LAATHHGSGRQKIRIRGEDVKLNILGTEYDYDMIKHDDDTRLRSDNDGFTDFYTKTIRVANDYYEDDPAAIKDFGALIKKIKRHEIIHAFFNESGLSEFANCERITEWIAIQSPKMFEAFKQVDAL
jgi:hypothetical protein